MNKKRKDYEAPSLTAEEVRIEKAFLADAAASANLPTGAEDGGDIPLTPGVPEESDTFPLL